MALTQDDLKRAVAQAAIAYVPNDCIVGVGTGSINLLHTSFSSIVYC